MENTILSTRGADGTVTISVLGEIDFTNADDVSQGIRDAIVEWAPPTILVDVQAATFIDSTGLGALIEGYRAATEGECRYRLVNPTKSFHRVLTVTGLCDLFGLPEPATAESSGSSFASSEATGA